MLTRSVLALLLAPLGGALAPDELQEELARLAAPQAAERAAAERWLQAHLVLERSPDLAEAALAGDAEVCARLARVLGSDPRHLGLALSLCAESDRKLATLGQEAVRTGVARAEPRLGEPALREGLDSLLAQAAGDGPPERWRLPGGRSLEELLEALNLAAELPLGLTADARVVASTARRESPVTEAPWNEVLSSLANGLGLTLECHGWPRGRTQDTPTGAFLRFAARGEPARTGVEIISEWLMLVALPGDELVRVRAARNLGATGFAPGLSWMEGLVRSRADRAALEGLLVAAARGRVAPVLTEPTPLDPLLRAAEEPGPGSIRILTALAHVGCLDVRGAPLAPRLLTGFERESARGRWIRLFLLERNGCAPLELSASARALLADGASPPALRLQALFTLASLAAGEGVAPEVAELPGLFELSLGSEEVERLGRALRTLGVPPPFADPARIPGSFGLEARRALEQAWLWNGLPGAVAAHLAAGLRRGAPSPAEGGEALAERLRPWLARGDGDRIARALDEAGNLAPDLAGELRRVGLLLGLVPADEVPALLDTLGISLAQGPVSDSAVLAALAGYPERLELEARAREMLLGGLRAVEGRSEEELARALRLLERAAQGLFAAGRDETARTEVIQPARQVLQRQKGPRRTVLPAWPRAPHPSVRDLAETLARCALPAAL